MEALRGSIEEWHVVQLQQDGEKPQIISVIHTFPARSENHRALFKCWWVLGFWPVTSFELGPAQNPSSVSDGSISVRGFRISIMMKADAVVMGVFDTMMYTVLGASTLSWLRKRSVDEQNNTLSS